MGLAVVANCGVWLQSAGTIVRTWRMCGIVATKMTSTFRWAKNKNLLVRAKKFFCFAVVGNL